MSLYEFLIHFENDWKSWSNILMRKLDDHGILMKLLRNFDQNLGGQPGVVKNSIFKSLKYK